MLKGLRTMEARRYTPRLVSKQALRLDFNSSLYSISLPLLARDSASESLLRDFLPVTMSSPVSSATTVPI